MFGIQAASHGGDEAALGQRGTQLQQHVVDEDDADADHEAGELAVAAVGHAQRQADQPEDQAGEGDRELLLDLDSSLWGRSPRARARPRASRARRSSFRSRPCGPLRGKYRSGSRPQHAAARTETPRTCRRRPACGVHPSSSTISTVRFCAVDDDPPVLGQIDGRGLPGPAVRHEDAVPAAADAGTSLHVEHDVGKVVEEDARTNLALRRVAATTLNVISRNAWLHPARPPGRRRASRPTPPGKQADRPQQPHQATPHACIATNSRSADSRPNATSRPSSSDIGIVSASA